MHYQHDYLHIEQLVLGQLQTNCYIVWDDKTQEAIIIDPADEGDLISQRILELQLDPKYIVLTHAHFDHVLGLLEVKLNFDLPILMHRADKFLLESLPQRARHWLQREVLSPPLADKYIDENFILEFGNLEFRTLLTPGHTPGSICLYNDQIIFSGDLIFKNAIGRTDFSYSSPSQMQESLQKISKLDQNLIIYPGHGERTKIKNEL